MSNCNGSTPVRVHTVLRHPSSRPTGNTPRPEDGGRIGAPSAEDDTAQVAAGRFNPFGTLRVPSSTQALEDLINRVADVSERTGIINPLVANIRNLNQTLTKHNVSFGTSDHLEQLPGLNKKTNSAEIDTGKIRPPSSILKFNADSFRYNREGKIEAKLADDNGLFHTIDLADAFPPFLDVTPQHIAQLFAMGSDPLMPLPPIGSEVAMVHKTNRVVLGPGGWLTTLHSIASRAIVRRDNLSGLLERHGSPEVARRRSTSRSDLHLSPFRDCDDVASLSMSEPDFDLSFENSALTEYPTHLDVSTLSVEEHQSMGRKKNFPLKGASLSPRPDRATKMSRLDAQLSLDQYNLATRPVAQPKNAHTLDVTAPVYQYLGDRTHGDMTPADDVFEKSYNLAVAGEDLSAYLPINLRTLIDAESVDGNAFATSPVARRPMLSPQGHDRKVPRLYESGSAADKRFQETLRLGPSGMSGIGHTSHVVSPRSRNNGSQWALRGFNSNESNASSIVNGNGIAAYQQSQRVHYRHSQRYDPRASNDWLCPKPGCNYNNFARNLTCKDCGHDRPAGVKTRHDIPLGSAGDWTCECGYINWRRRVLCQGCWPDHPSNDPAHEYLYEPRLFARDPNAPREFSFQAWAARWKGLEDEPGGITKFRASETKGFGSLTLLGAETRDATVGSSIPARRPFDSTIGNGAIAGSSQGFRTSKSSSVTNHGKIDTHPLWAPRPVSQAIRIASPSSSGASSGISRDARNKAMVIEV